MAKTVAVFGATGNQGGSVVRALVRDTDFKVRAVTRNVTGEKASELNNLGCEVVQGDLNNKESIRLALENVQYVFLVTNSWETLDHDKEVKQGQNVIEEAKVAGVEHIIFSGLENSKQLTGLECPSFDAKGCIEDHLTKSDVPYTIIRLPFYFENFITVMKPQPTGGDNYSLAVPMGDKPMAGMSVTDTGAIIKSVLKDTSRYAGQTIGVAGDSITIEQYSAILSKYLTPKTFADSKITTSAYAGLGFPGAQALANMFELFQSEHYIRDITVTKNLNKDVASFEQWVQRNTDLIAESLK